MTTLEEWRAVAVASLGLSDEKLLGVLALVEQVPDRGQVIEVLDRIRPRLVTLRPPRPMTPQRLLFRPVEDLFDPPERYCAKIGRLSRQTTNPCWVIVHAHLDPALHQRTAHLLKTLDPTNLRDVYRVGLTFWRAAGAALSTFVASDACVGSHRMGDSRIVITEDIRQQLLDIADVLDIAPEIESVKINLPERPIAALSQVDVELLSDVISRLGVRSTRTVQAFILVILARMATPGDLLRVLNDVALPCTTKERDGLLAQVGTNALASLANEAQELRKRGGLVADPAVGAREAEQMVSRLVSLERSLGGMRDRRVSETVQVARREIGAYVLNTLATSADASLFETLKPARDASGQLQTVEPSLEQLEKSEQSALVLRRCSTIANATGVGQEMNRKVTGICAELEREGRAPQPDDRLRDVRLMRSVRLIELIAGPDEAQRVLMAQN